jgi:hypothetical protein
LNRTQKILVLIIVILHFADLATSIYGFELHPDIGEGNPLLDFANNKTLSSYTLMTLIKVNIVLCFVLATQYIADRIERQTKYKVEMRKVFIVAMIFGILWVLITVINNIIVIFSVF